MLPPIFERLKTSSEVRAIVGSNPPRIYRHGEAKQDLPKDVAYITWFMVTLAPENHLSGTPPTDRVIVQINCWHPTDAGVVALAKAVRDVMEPVCYMTGAPVDQRDPETRRFWIALQFDWFEDR